MKTQIKSWGKKFTEEKKIRRKILKAFISHTQTLLWKQKRNKKKEKCIEKGNLRRE